MTNGYHQALSQLIDYNAPTANGAQAHQGALAALVSLDRQLRPIIAGANGRPSREDFQAVAAAVQAHGSTIGGMFDRVFERDDTINDATKALNVVRMCATRALGAATVTGSRDEWLGRMGTALARLELANARAIAHWDQQGLIGHEPPG